jgi:hypothetical protein
MKPPTMPVGHGDHVDPSVAIVDATGRAAPSRAPGATAFHDSAEVMRLKGAARVATLFDPGRVGTGVAPTLSR